MKTLEEFVEELENKRGETEKFWRENPENMPTEDDTSRWIQLNQNIFTAKFLWYEQNPPRPEPIAFNPKAGTVSATWGHLRIQERGGPLMIQAKTDEKGQWYDLLRVDLVALLELNEELNELVARHTLELRI